MRGWRPDEAVVELSIPRGVRSGSALDVSLAGLGIANLWLHVRVHVEAGA